METELSRLPILQSQLKENEIVLHVHNLTMNAVTFCITLIGIGVFSRGRSVQNVWEDAFHDHT